ncbi:MAG: ATP-binding protein [Saprospiraceae bacterium]|nr:ATP-binding protein [Saprospiraceae bacterium]
MLVQFSVRNFKTFKDEAKLTMFASNYDKSTREEDNVFEVPKFDLRLLKSAVIYGANASGKTKLINATNVMRELILNSSKESQEGEPINTEPFRLSTSSEGQPTLFELVFIHKEDMFRYGFEVTKEAVVSEWLYYRPKTKETEIFYREGQEFNLHPTLFKKGTFLVKENMVRPNALMLSVAAQFNDNLAKRVFEWLRQFRQLSGLREDGYMGFSMHKASEKGGKVKILDWLKSADIGIDDIRVETMNISDLPSDLPDEIRMKLIEKIKDKDTKIYSDLVTVHTKYDDSNNQIDNEEFKLMEEESSGTRKFFALSGPIIQALDNGEVLLVDELDSKIHPNLVCKIVNIFNSKEANPKNAQLIFNTHDTNLLGSGLFRRDQIWFVEKDQYGAATLYPLSSFKTSEGARKTDNYEENYIMGRYGGVPVLSDFYNLFKPEVIVSHENEK